MNGNMSKMVQIRKALFERGNKSKHILLSAVKGLVLNYKLVRVLNAMPHWVALPERSV